MKRNEIMPHVHFSIPHTGLAFMDFKFMKSSFSLIPHLLLKAMVQIFWPGYQKIPHLILYERQLQGNEISQQ